MASNNPFDFLGLDEHEEEVINPRLKIQLDEILKELDETVKGPMPPKPVHKDKE